MCSSIAPSRKRLGLLGLGQDYLEERQGSFFVAEIAHALQARAARPTIRVRVTLQLLDVRRETAPFLHGNPPRRGRLDRGDRENLGLHMDMTTRKVAPFPDDIQANLAVMKAVSCAAR